MQLSPFGGFFNLAAPVLLSGVALWEVASVESFAQLPLGVYRGSDMNIETLEINKINPAVYNPRKDLQPGDPEYEKLRKSIVEFDMVEPLIWNKRSGNLVGGHQRLKILKSMDIKSVEVSVVDLDDAKEKALNLALNKISGEWDLPALKDLLEELDTGAFDMEITGFDLKEIEDLMNQLHVPEEGLTDDDAVPEATESVCRKGDLWSLGNHRLLCGDATLKEDVDKLMGGEKADMVFTDPPYGINLDTDYSSMVGKLKRQHNTTHGHKYAKVKGDDVKYDPAPIFEHWGYCEEIFLWGADYYMQSLPANGSWVVWDKRLEDSADKMFGSCFELCWSKSRHKRDIARIKWAGIFGTEKEHDHKRTHPTQKPVLLPLWFMEKYKGAIVADPYGGSGSTLIACEKLGRRCFMMEISEMYCTVILKRWEAYTGKQAVLVSGATDV
ncbi:hypothetical protein LCGC14_0749260 [marine sediment metagenome]|uniref:ParB-like N-terminal domain-containing protein n=1 Tax=marine sediment metagenome TaxID=412755 RepID=A0A0F9SPL9_9ZZZZ